MHGTHVGILSTLLQIEGHTPIEATPTSPPTKSTRPGPRILVDKESRTIYVEIDTARYEVTERIHSCVDISSIEETNNGIVVHATVNCPVPFTNEKIPMACSASVQHEDIAALTTKIRTEVQDGFVELVIPFRVDGTNTNHTRTIILIPAEEDNSTTPPIEMLTVK